MVGIEDEAIVLRAVDFGESDLIAHLLVPEIGRLTVIAKHARKSRKRFPGSLDIFNHIRVRVSASNSNRLLVWRILPMFREVAGMCAWCTGFALRTG